MTEPKAIFFDMDGTILDWTTGMEESWLASCELHADGTIAPSPDRTLVQVSTAPVRVGVFLGLCEPADAPTFTAQVRVFVHSFSANALADRPFRILLED